MSKKAEADKEAANWTKASTGLTITKNGLALAIITILDTFVLKFTREERGHLPIFLKNILEEETSNVNVEFIKKRNDPRCSWKITGNCQCRLRLCQNILDRLCNIQVNNSKNVVWRPKAEESKLHSHNADKTTRKYVTCFAERCFICREDNCPFQRNRQGVPLFNDELSGEIVKIYWPLAIMYMFRGKEKNNFPNTGPEDTDAALIFKLMKNCNLFSINEDDVDNGIYDELLEVRNILMHSADNRLTDDALDECFDRMVKILNVKKFSNGHSEKAIKELETLKDMRILMTTLTSEEASIVKQAFDSQQSALKFEINVRGTLKNEYVLEGILKASKAKREQYVGNDKTTDVKPKAQEQGGAATATGAATGAVIGAIGGPPGAILGAAVGALYGKLFE